MEQRVLNRARFQLRYRRALRSLAQPSVADPSYQSVFRGLWTDRRDALDEIDRRLELGSLTQTDAELLRHWVEHGYVILQGAVEPAVCDSVRSELEYAGSER